MAVSKSTRKTPKPKSRRKPKGESKITPFDYPIAKHIPEPFREGFGVWYTLATEWEAKHGDEDWCATRFSRSDELGGAGFPQKPAEAFAVWQMLQGLRH